MSDQIEARYLPKLLQEMVEIVGLAHTMTLVEHYGGSRMYVPMKFDPTHPVAKIIGHESFAKLFQTYGGIELEIPFGTIALKACRDSRIREARAAGATYSQLAARFRMTERHLRNICGPETNDKQANLF